MIAAVVNKIRDELINTFGQLNIWFSIDDELLNYTPKNGGWTIASILEHVSITNHYLMILIRKGTDKAILKGKSTNTNDLIKYEMNWDALQKIGEHRAFEWNRPGHMEPAGIVSLSEVQNKLHQHLETILDYLNQMPNGEGALYKTTMSVNNLGKIDVYHYIYF